jgi:hypothetical protein
MEKAGNGLLQAFQACDDGPALCQQVKEYLPKGYVHRLHSGKKLAIAIDNILAVAHIYAPIEVLGQM